MCELCNKNIMADKRIDLGSLSALEILLEQGYNKVKWVSEPTGCSKCLSLDGMEWDLQEYINNITHDAGIFSYSHPNCLCYIIVSKNDIEEIKVNYLGIIEE